MRITVNGTPRELDVPADRRLVDVLRDDLGLVGTKEGCGIGVCGICSVTLDGALVSACLVLAVLADGRSVETIEGLGRGDGSLTPLQEAFIREGGFQCGICTSAQIVAGTALLREQPHPDETAIREFMLGNLCRCTGYEGIVRAITSASDAEPPR